MTELMLRLLAVLALMGASIRYNSPAVLAAPPAVRFPRFNAVPMVMLRVVPVDADVFMMPPLAPSRRVFPLAIEIVPVVLVELLPLPMMELTSQIFPAGVP